MLIAVTGLEDTNSLCHKKSELRLYCDLMMQQVHAVKSAATSEEGPEVQVGGGNFILKENISK